MSATIKTFLLLGVFCTVVGLVYGFVTEFQELADQILDAALVAKTSDVDELKAAALGDGTVAALIDWQRAALSERHALAAEMLRGVPFRAQNRLLAKLAPMKGDVVER